MNPNYNISSCTKENISTIVDGINKYNLKQIPALAPLSTPLNYVIKNEQGEEIAGLLSRIDYWNGLNINILWVKKAYRKQGLGRQLLQYVEKIAIEKGATVSMLDTFDFQAEGFYLKNGYEIIGEVKDFPKGHRRVYFSKVLRMYI